MQLLDLTLPSAPENIALDEALLDRAESSGRPFELLRMWESSQPIVVVGRSSRVADEVHCQTCRELEIPILRRSSGGAAIVAGPGCLMYAVVLSYERRPDLRIIDHAHRFVLRRMVHCLTPLVAGIRHEGTSDLTLKGRKFSGNSLRCKRSHLLYHGTILYDYSQDLIQRCLKSPPRQPSYRAGRDHSQFVRNLPVTQSELRQALAEGWQANFPLLDWPQERTRRLVDERYRQDAWNLSR